MKVIGKRKRRKTKRKTKSRSRRKRNIMNLIAGETKMKRRRRKSSRNEVRRRHSRSRTFSERFDVANILTNGAIAGIGAVGTVFVANSISKLVGGVSTQTRNLTLLATTLGLGYALSKTQFKKYVPTVTTGALVIAMLEIAKTSFGTDLLTLSGFGQDDSIAEIVSNIDTTQLGIVESGDALLGVIEGDEVEEYL